MSTLEPPARVKKPGGFALWLARMQMAHGRKLVIAMPYIWLILLFLLPFLIVFKISLAEMARAIPPYTDLWEWADGQLTLTVNLGNFLQLTDDPLYFEAYLQSLQVAAISTICCLSGSESISRMMERSSLIYAGASSRSVFSLL